MTDVTQLLAATARGEAQASGSQTAVFSVLELPAAERGAYLDQVGEDTWLRQQIDALLVSNPLADHIRLRAGRANRHCQRLGSDS